MGCGDPSRLVILCDRHAKTWAGKVNVEADTNANEARSRAIQGAAGRIPPAWAKRMKKRFAVSQKVPDGPPNPHKMTKAEDPHL